MEIIRKRDMSPSLIRGRALMCHCCDGTVGMSPFPEPQLGLGDKLKVSEILEKEHVRATVPKPEIIAFFSRIFAVVVAK